MASFNQCTFIGTAGRDAEIRYTNSGMAVANVSIACNYKSNGEELVEWVNLVFWDKVAEIAGEYVKKGKPIFVQGRLQTRKWQDKEGVDRYSTEIVVNSLQLLGSRSDDDRQDGGRASSSQRGGRGDDSRPQQRAAAPSQSPRRQTQPPTGTGFDDMEDDIPF